MLDAVTLLDRAPRGVQRLAYQIAAGRGALGRLADVVRYRYSAEDLPSLPSPSSEAVRLLIGPANSAGQGYQWARAVERNLPGTTAVAMHGIGANPFQPNADVRVPVAVYQRSPSWHAEFEAFLNRQSHVLWESGLPLLGRRFGSDVNREITHLRDRGVRGALLFHGSDIRPPSLHSAQSRWSPFSTPSALSRSLELSAAKNASLAADSGVPVFVSTPDLLQWVPDAVWCPVVVDFEEWRDVGTSRKHEGPIVVAHAPSQKRMKGTDQIEPMLRRLAEQGIIEYRQVINVPHSSMPAFYADADVVLDQFALGSYGVAACEAMASGRLVMSHIDSTTRSRVVELTGRELPIHEATIETLEAELRKVANEPEKFEALRVAGPDFVAAVHDGRRAAAAIAPFLGLSA